MVCPIFALTTPQWRSYSLSDALRDHLSWARFVTGEFGGGAIRGAFGRIRSNRSVSVSASNPRFRWRTILADVWCHPAPLNVQINRMYKRAFAKIAIIGCRIAARQASASKETELSDSIRCGSICDEQAGSSLKAFRTSHAVSVLPLQTSSRSGLFHTEAGDLRGQLLPGPFAKIAIIGCRIAARQASASKETELSDSIRCGSICDEQAGSSLKAFRTSHAVSVLPLQTSSRSGLFHTEAGDLRGQLLPGPQTGSRVSMSPGDATDLSMPPSGSGAFSMSPPPHLSPPPGGMSRLDADPHRPSMWVTIGRRLTLATDAGWQRLVRPPGLKVGSWHLRCGTLASLLGIHGGPAELKGQPPRSSVP